MVFLEHYFINILTAVTILDLFYKYSDNSNVVLRILFNLYLNTQMFILVYMI